MHTWKTGCDHNLGVRDRKFTVIGMGRIYNKGSNVGWYWPTAFKSS